MNKKEYLNRINKYELHLRKYQKKCLIKQRKPDKCLINMWCGTGKTRTFTIDLFINRKKLNVIVFPSLLLINQYCNNYILSKDKLFIDNFKKFKYLSFCSDDDKKLKKQKKIIFTTDEDVLMDFLNKSKNKIILVTYHSFEKFIDICINKNIKLNNLIYDEAHHVVGDNIQNIVFNNENLDNIVDKTRYYTATPINKNGIIMYDREELDNSDCGPLAYEYLYYQAVEDKICKDFELQLTMYINKTEYENKYQPIFECIIRSCLSGKYKYWNILTYHAFVNENDDMNSNTSFVKDFASSKNQKLIKKLFTKIQNNEFPHTKKNFNVENVILKGIHSKSNDREHVIKDFDKKVNGRIYILSSCDILNEGIDTKWANMGVPINASQSIVKESQRIGRLVRIPEGNMPASIILIPCMIDINKYSSMDTNKLKDKLIREELSENGNFNVFLNVMSAFRYQYDSELYEMCLKYPNMYAPKEIKRNLTKQGFKVKESKGNLLENLKYLCDKQNINCKFRKYSELNDEEILKKISKVKNIEIHTQNYNEPIKYIGDNDDEPIRLFHCQDDNIYSPIIKREGNVQKHQNIKPPNKRKKLFNIHTHPDLDVLWKIKDSSIDFDKEFCQGILDVNIEWRVKNWYDKLQKVKHFINKNKCRPSSTSKDKDEKVLGSWISQQSMNYTKKNKIMKDNEIYDKWTEFITDKRYKQYFISNNDKWLNDLQKVKHFINKNKCRPSKHSKDKDEKVLGLWIGTQSKNYTKKTHIMKYNKINDKWTKFITDKKYKEYFISNNDKWLNDLQKVKNFIDKKKCRPSSKSKNIDEKVLGLWISTQSQNYTKKTNIMKDIEIYDKWTEFITDKKYKQYFISNNDKWLNDLQKVKKFIDKNNCRPSSTSKNKDEKVLASWINNQSNKYTKKNKIMKDKEIYYKWIEFIIDRKYKEYFISNNDKWLNDLQKVKNFINKNKCRPSTHSKDKDEKVLGSWIGTQSQNYTKKNKIMKDNEIYDKWTEFITDKKYKEYFISNNDKWLNNLQKVKNFIDKNKCKPSTISKNINEKVLGAWIGTQSHNYIKKTNIMKDNEIYDKWTEFITDNRYKQYFSKYATTTKNMSKPDIKSDIEIKSNTKSSGNKQPMILSELSKLHKKYKSMNSTNLNEYFKNDNSLWKQYHTISKTNEKSFPTEEIPRNKIIKYLKELKGNKKKIIADLGCGYGEIYQSLSNNKRFTFLNFDHISSSKDIISRDIKDTKLQEYSIDIAILSLSMWGSNCYDYIKEAYRILDIGGTLLIAEPYKRWYDKENDENKLIKLLESYNFKIIKNDEMKFMLIECRK